MWTLGGRLFALQRRLSRLGTGVWLKGLSYPKTFFKFCELMTDFVLGYARVRLANGGDGIGSQFKLHKNP